MAFIFQLYGPCFTSVFALEVLQRRINAEIFWLPLGLLGKSAALLPGASYPGIALKVVILETSRLRGGTIVCLTNWHLPHTFFLFNLLKFTQVLPEIYGRAYYVGS